MECIRLEYEDGIGIFQSYLPNEEPRKFLLDGTKYGSIIRKNHTDFNDPYQDGMEDSFTSEHLCAYWNINQLLEIYLKEHILDLIENGIKVFKIKIKTGLYGQDQICFKPQDIIEKTDITNQIIERYDD